MVVVFAITLALYAATAPRTVALEDDGDFIMAAYYLGIPHPPGYPLYVLAAKPFTLLPFGSVAYRVHLASGALGAATCAVLWWVAMTLGIGTAASYLAALGYGFSEVFWSQAIIAEVYTLNTFLFFTLFASSLAYLHYGRPALLSLIAFVCGLGLANHWPLFVVAIPCIAVVLLERGAALARDAWAARFRLVASFAAGLLPYAWLVLRSRSAPALAFYGAVDSWHDFWFLVSRSGYTWTYDPNSAASAWDTLSFGGFLLKECVWQFTPLGAVLALAGILLQWRRWGLLTSTGLILAFAGATVPLFRFIDGEYDFVTQFVLRVFPLVPYGVMALWMGLGASAILDHLRERSRVWWALGQGVGLVLLGASLALNLGVNDRHDYTFARDFAVTLLESFAPGATVFTTGDADTLSLGYFHFVEGVRPDIRLLSIYGISVALDGRMFDPVKLTWGEKMDALTSFAERADGPVYFFDHAPPSLSDQNYGFYRKVDKSTTQKVTFLPRRDLIALFRRIEADSSETDSFTIMQRDLVIAQVAGILTPLIYLTPGDGYAEFRPDLERASRHFSGLLERIRSVEQYGGADENQILQWIDEAEGLVTPTVRRTSHASLYVMKARALARLGRSQEAIAALKQSLAIDQTAKNPARKELERLGLPVPERSWMSMTRRVEAVALALTLMAPAALAQHLPRRLVWRGTITTAEGSGTLHARTHLVAGRDLTTE